MKKKVFLLSIIYLITFGLLMGAYSLYVVSEIKDTNNIYKYIAKDKADHIATTVNNVLLRSAIMNALIQDHDGGTEFFDQMADFRTPEEPLQFAHRPGRIQSASCKAGPQR